MLIINPLYDNAFKYLMDNEQMAKMVLGIVMGETVVSLQSKPQETQMYTDSSRKTARYDFKAIVRGSDGADRCILIELQKYKHPDPVQRFREYLAENYRKEETIIDTHGKEQRQSLPIVTIYILGYNITQAEILALQVHRSVRDIIWDRPVTEKLDFVEQLTHTSYIFQVAAKPEEKRGTRLEHFLGLFSQKVLGDEANYLIDVELADKAKEDKDISQIVSYLNRATLDEAMVRSLKYEESYEKGVRHAEQELQDALRDVEAERMRAEKEMQRAEKERAEKEAERAEKEAERAEKEKERAEKEKALQDMTRTILQLNSLGMTVEQMASITSKEPAFVEQVIRDKK